MGVDWAAAKARTDVLVPWITTVALVLGGLYTLEEYRSKQEEQRIDRAFSYVSRFSSPPMSDHRTRLASAWDGHEAEILAILRDSDISSGEKAKRYDESLLDIVSAERLSVAAEETIGFFEQVARCQRLGLCDGETTEALLRPHATEFFHQFYPYVCAVRSRWNDPDAGAELQLFVKPSADPKRLCVR